MCGKDATMSAKDAGKTRPLAPRTRAERDHERQGGDHERLHLFPLLPALRQKIDAAQARYLRRILKLPAAYISKISQKEVRRRCGTYRFSTFIFRAQLRWLGHILRKPATDPLRRILFEPNSPLNPRRPPSLNPNRPASQRVGRPQTNWTQFPLFEIYRLSRTPHSRYFCTR